MRAFHGLGYGESDAHGGSGSGAGFVGAGLKFKGGHGRVGEGGEGP